jgi:hypothetical protein
MAADAVTLAGAAGRSHVHVTGVRHDVRREAHLVLAVALATLLVVAYRASVAVSFYDDSHYVTMALRIANGAKPLVDEMSLQSLGFIVPAAFTWLWTRAVGTTGLVIAYRLFYLVLAAGTAAIVYRSLRDLVRPAIAGAAAMLPLLCPPFNLVAPSYNTLAMLGFAVAFASGYRALRFGSRSDFLLAGAAMAFAAISYPPLSVAMLVLLATVVVASRSPRALIPLAAGAVATVVVLLGWLLPFVHLAEVKMALQYASANVSGFSSPLKKFSKDALYIVRALALPQAWPMLALVVGASLPRLSRAIRAALLLALPVAAAVPGLLWLAQDTLRLTFGTTAPAWLIAFVFGAAVPVTIWARRSGRKELMPLLALSAPSAIAGVLVVTYSTNASLARAVPVVGLVPLGISVLAVWLAALEDLGGDLLSRTGAVVALGAVVLLLFTASLDDARPGSLHSGFRSGPYAAMHMSWVRYTEMHGLQEVAAKYVRPRDHVTFLGERTGYLLVGGRPYTNAVWLYPGRSDRITLSYFARRRDLPEVVFVDVRSWRKLHWRNYRNAAPGDPFLSIVLAEYRLVDSVADFDVYVRQTVTR